MNVEYDKEYKVSRLKENIIKSFNESDASLLVGCVDDFSTDISLLEFTDTIWVNLRNSIVVLTISSRAGVFKPWMVLKNHISVITLSGEFPGDSPLIINGEQKIFMAEDGFAKIYGHLCQAFNLISRERFFKGKCPKSIRDKDNLYHYEIIWEYGNGRSIYMIKHQSSHICGKDADEILSYYRIPGNPNIYVAEDKVNHNKYEIEGKYIYKGMADDYTIILSLYQKEIPLYLHYSLKDFLMHTPEEYLLFHRPLRVDMLDIIMEKYKQKINKGILKRYILGRDSFKNADFAIIAFANTLSYLLQYNVIWNKQNL